VQRRALGIELPALPSRPFRRLALTFCSALALWVLPALPAGSPVEVPGHLAASGPWLDRFNQWRSNAGVAPLTENTLWSQGDNLHSQYMVLNDLVTHYETPGTPYYTTDGDTSARNGNIYVSSTTSTADTQAIDWWMGAPFHAMGMMDPRLTATGFGAYRATKSGWQMGATVDVLRGNSFSGGAFPVYFPGNGTTEPLTTYSGNEFPDPLQACPGYSSPTGLPLFIELGGNVRTVAGPAHTLTGNGTPLNHCVIDSTNSALSGYLVSRGGVIVIPQQPLQTGVKYVVSLTVNGAPYTWSFTVGPFVTCTSVSAVTDKTSPQPLGTSLTLTASAGGCPNPQYEIWIRNPNAVCCQLLQPYGPSATYIWNTTGLAAGTYTFAIWAKDAKSTGAYSNSLGSYDSSVVIQFTIGSACASVTAAGTPASPQAAGMAVAVTGTAVACPNPRYQYEMLPPGSNTWQVVQPYSTAATYSWSTTSAVAGIYKFIVKARDAASAGTAGSSTGTWDAYTSLAYTLTATACRSIGATTSPSGTATPGTSVAVTGAAAGCANPRYQFEMLPPGSQTWQVVQPYSSSNVFHWTTTGAALGGYRFIVKARDASSAGTLGNSTSTWDAYVSIPYTLTSSCTSVTATSAPSGTATAGTAVSVTGAAAGCASPTYQFEIQAPGSQTWQVVQPYSSSAVFNWNTTGATKGTYKLIVKARDASSSGTAGISSTGTWDSYVLITYTLT